MKSLLLTGAILAPLAAAASDAAQMLEPVFVTATRSAQTGQHFAAAVRTITRDDIAASGAAHIVDLLRGIGAAQVGDLFGDGSRATVDVRGFGEGAHSSTLVLVDGRRLNNPDIGPPDLNSISLKDVERIEIIQGSAGTLYGDQAVGGVINIITRTPGAFAADAELGLGSYSGRRARAALANGSGPGLNYRLSLEGRDGDNYRAHNRLRYRNGLARASYDYAGGGMFAEAGAVDEKLQTPGALLDSEMAQDRRQSTANFSEDFSNTRSASQRLGWDHQFESWQAATELTHRRSDGRSRLSGIAFKAGSDFTQERDIWSLNPRATGNFATRYGSASYTVGADLQRADYEIATSLARQSNEQRTREAYAQLILPLPPSVDVTLGQRFARVDNRVSEQSFNAFFTPVFTTPTDFSDTQSVAEFGIAFRPADSLRMFARYDGNYRYAKVDELVGSTAPGGSNSVAVQTQSGNSMELGGEWVQSRYDARLTLYRLGLRHEIAFDPTAGAFGAGANINLDATRRDGVIAEAGWNAGEALRLAASLHHLNAAVTEGALRNQEIPLVAANNGRLAAALKLPQNLQATLELLGTGARRFGADFRNALPKLPGFAVTNLALSGEWGPLRLSARVNNLLNKQYSEIGFRTQLFPPPAFAPVDTPSYFPSPERNFWVGASLSL